MPLAYKIVNNRGGVLRSLSVANLADIRVIYEVGKVAVPQIAGSKLFVYTIDNPPEQCGESYEMYLCEVDTLEIPRTIAVPLRFQIRDFWQTPESQRRFNSPTGSTRWCNTVRLIERVW